MTVCIYSTAKSSPLQTPLTLWNIQEQKNRLTTENKHHRFQHGSNELRSPGSSVVFPAQSFNMTSLHLQVSTLSCAISLQHLSSVWRWSKHSRGPTWAQCSGISAPIRATNNFPSIILIRNKSGLSIAKCLWFSDVTLDISRVQDQGRIQLHLHAIQGDSDLKYMTLNTHLK